MVAGLDIGGTKVVAVVATEDGTVRAAHRVPTPAAQGSDAILDVAAAAVRAACTQGGVPLPARLGVGTAGVVDRAAGRVVAATTALTGWAGTDVAGGLAARLGTDRPVVLNDVHAFALAEGWRGAAAGHEDYVAVTLGTGVGGAVVAQGRLLEGAHHRAGHLGHVVVPQAAGLACPCGGTGHLESVASGPAMVEALRALGRDVGTAEDVGVALRAGDEAAAAVVRRAGDALGTALAGLAAALDPSVVVVGGGALGVGDVLLDAARSGLATHALSPLGALPVRPSAVEQAVAVGAVRAALGGARSATRGEEVRP
nr:ROK family protein [uncultured Actinotalea sp.]